MHSVRDRKLKQWKIAAALLIFMVTGYAVLIAETDETNGVLRSRAYKFYHIKSQQAKDMLSRLKIGKSYDALSDEVLIVTSDKGDDLIKATGVITVLDQKKPVQMRVLMVAAAGQPLPDLSAFIAGMKTLSAGTMADAPTKGSNNPAIIDIIDNKLIAIAAEELLPEIEKAVEEWKKQSVSALPAEQAVQKSPAEMKQPQTPGVIVEQSAIEKPQPEQKTTPVEPLEAIATQLLNEPNDMSVPEMPTELPAAPAVKEPAGEDLTDMLKTEPNTTEDYIGDELLKTLLDEEKKTQQPPKVQEPNQPEIAAVPGPQPSTQPTPVEEPRRSDAVSESLRLQREVALLRQQMAELKGEEPAPVETVEPPKKSEEPQPKIITEAGDKTKTEISKQAANEELETTMDIPQEMMLESLVDLVGKQLGLNYMYDPATLSGQKVFLKLNQGKVKVRDLYALMESVLRFRGFVMTRRDNLVTIVKDTDLAKVDTVLVTPDESVEAGNIVVSGVFQLKNISTDSAQAILTNMKLGLPGGFQAVPETGTLIVTDYAYRMDQIRNVLDIVDVSGGKKLEYRQLNYMQAADLITKLQTLVEQMEGVSLQVGTTATIPQPTRAVTTRDPKTGRPVTTQVPVNVAAPGGGKTASPNTVYIDTDERTNRILMIGTQEQIDIINKLIDTLDVAQFGLKYVREYIIQYVEAIEVVNVLNELGLANVTVSTQTTSTTAMTTAESRRRIPIPQQPGQPAAVPGASPTAGASAATDNQPNISIRPATNSLLVNATAEQHNAIELVIAHVDVVQKDQRTIREYEIQYVDTQEIIDTMTELGMISQRNIQGSSSYYNDRSSRDGRSSRTSQQQQLLQQQQMAQEAAPTLTGFGSEGAEGGDVTAQEPQIAVLEATNSLLVFATPRQHEAIALLIAHADRTPETATTPYVVYALENQVPSDLAENLNKLVQETVAEQGKTSTPESKIQTGAPTTSTTPKLPTLEEQKIRIIPDDISYSLIVYANKRNQQWISELIRELDEYRPQVLLDCTLVEITRDESFKYDLDIVSKTYRGLTLRPESPTTNVTGAGDFSVQQYGDARSTSGNFTGFYNSDMIQALLETVQKDGYGRIMAKPKILVNDNQEGEIKTQTTTAVPQEKTNVQLPATGGTPVTTTDINFTDYTAGVNLKIKPHISKGNMLRLEITLNRTDFAPRGNEQLPSGSVPVPPDRLSTDVTTVSTVPDGTTIILGGLETIKQSKSQTKIPLLGDLPIVGGLFRGVDDSGKQGKLYVFVKANILRPSDQAAGLEDIRRVSSENRKAFEGMEEKFQETQDWPGVKPKPMDPEKVLEEDDASK